MSNAQNSPALEGRLETTVRPQSIEARLTAERLMALAEGRKHAPERRTLDEAAGLLMRMAEALDCAATDAECQRVALERLTRERDEWAAKWQAERRKYAELRWPGLNGRVRALEAQRSR